MSAVEPALHGAASAAFNTSRQVGAAIGVATFGPLLGATHDLGDGFVTCLVVGAAATAAALLLTALTRPAAAAVRRGPSATCTQVT
jgi:MFS transporter, DHA2 family, methylenomycin A resistance protein